MCYLCHYAGHTTTTLFFDSLERYNHEISNTCQISHINLDHAQDSGLISISLLKNSFPVSKDGRGIKFKKKNRYLDISYLDWCAAGQSLTLEGREVREVVCVQEVNG